MYQKGDVFIESGYDARLDDPAENDYDTLFLCLPHSCENWVIGGEKEARQLIQDLEEAIKQLPPEGETKTQDT